MSERDVEAVRRAWEAWDAGDTDALMDFYAPDVEWDMTGSGVADMGVFHGREGIRTFFREFREPFDSYWARAEEFIDAGEGRVVVRIRQGGRIHAANGRDENRRDHERCVQTSGHPVLPRRFVKPALLSLTALRSSGLSPTGC